VKTYYIYVLSWAKYSGVYIGYTSNIEDRFRRHMREWSIVPEKITVVDRANSYNEALRTETRWIARYAKDGVVYNRRLSNRMRITYVG
jgi:predicted GIY-YIG superfamily endonuclease